MIPIPQGCEEKNIFPEDCYISIEQNQGLISLDSKEVCFPLICDEL